MSIGWPGCHGSAALSLTACAGVAELDLGVRLCGGGARVAAQRAGGWNWCWCTGRRAGGAGGLRRVGAGAGQERRSMGTTVHAPWQCGGRSDGGSALQMWFFMVHRAAVAVVDRVAGVPRERGAVLDSMRGGRRAWSGLELLLVYWAARWRGWRAAQGWRAGRGAAGGGLELVLVYWAARWRGWSAAQSWSGAGAGVAGGLQRAGVGAR